MQAAVVVAKQRLVWAREDQAPEQNTNISRRHRRGEQGRTVSFLDKQMREQKDLEALRVQSLSGDASRERLAALVAELVAQHDSHFEDILRQARLRRQADLMASKHSCACMRVCTRVCALACVHLCVYA